MKTKSLAYIEQPLKNRGDESAHRGIIRRLNAMFPELDIFIIFLGESYADIKEFIVDNPKNHYIVIPQYKGAHWALLKGFYHHAIWKIHPSLRKYMSTLKKCDVVMCSPGGVNMGGFQNYEHLAFLEMACSLGKPVVYYGRSIGPFPASTQREIMFKAKSIDLLNRFAYISVRDFKSAQEMRNLGIGFAQTIDCAFLDPTDLSRINIDIPALPEKYAVIVPNALKWHYAFKNNDISIIRSFYVKLIRCLAEKYPDIDFVMLPQTYNETTYLRKDYNFFKEIENDLNDPRIVVLDEIYGSDIQQAIIRNARFVIGSRYHSIVFAINQGVPFVALSYEHKIEGLLSILNLKSRMVNLSSESFATAFSADRLVESCVQILSTQPEPINAATFKARAMALEKINDIRPFL